MPVNRPSAATPVRRWRSLIGQARIPLLTMLLILAGIWLVVPLLPEESGWRFGGPYRLLYSSLVVAAAGLFLLLKAQPLRLQTGGLGVAASIVLVYLSTVALLVAIGAAVPQFQRPQTAQEEATSQVERGRAIFTSPSAGCFLCHAIGGGAASRGPDLAGVAGGAGTRRPGMDAEEYLRESITTPGAYLVPSYAPIMPPDLAQRLSSEQMDDLIAYLLTLK
ncbi:MAG: cytochrome c [Chloroflexi bacterium]|nr:cytochrome c [Chloroflexota bacterium]